jgi:hypothetical protein
MICLRRATRSASSQWPRPLGDASLAWSPRRSGRSLSVDRLGLRPPADRLGEMARPRGIDDHQRQRSAGERRHDRLEAACRLDRDPLRLKRALKRSTSSAKPSPSCGRGRAVRQNVNVEPIFRHVDPDISCFHFFHPSPSLRNRALADQATVRGRWTNGGATRLRDGLQGPRTSRRPLRIRAFDTRRRRQ